MKELWHKMKMILGAITRTIAPNFNRQGNTVPGAPTIGTATAAGAGSAEITFTAPPSNGGKTIQRYTAYSTPGNISGFVEQATSGTITVEGLADGVDYTFVVRAENQIGEGPASAASNEITMNLGVPGAPTSVLLSRGGSGEVIVNATAPTDTGGSAITSYKATASPGGLNATGALPLTITGLTDGVAVTVTVTASNINGEGAPSAASSPLIPATVPGAPTNVVATRGASSGTVVLNFDAPASNGGLPITGYTATPSPASETASGGGSPLTVVYLDDGTPYTFTIFAQNDIGPGAASTASNSVTPATVPGAPTITSLTRGNGQVSVAFTAPASTGGAAIDEYTIYEVPGSGTWTGTASPIVATGLVNGDPVAFYAKATNEVGEGAASATTATVTPATVPGAPTIGTATAGNGTVSVAFTAPASDGGEPIELFTATLSPGGATNTGTTSPIIVTASNGTAYTGSVTATNDVGTGSASAASNSVTPQVSITVPGAPTIGTATRVASGTVSCTFTPPASNGGSPILHYIGTVSPSGATEQVSGSPVQFTGLTDGVAVTVSVVAVNAAGPSAPSAASNSATPAGTPSVPGVPFVTTTASGSANIWVGYPVSDGGSAITHYRYTASPGGATLLKTAAEVDAAAIVFTGLTDGVAYSFTATPINQWGDGVTSAASNTVTPGSSAGPYDAYYAPGFTPISHQTLLTTPTQSLPAKATSRATASYTDARFGTRVYRTVNTLSGEWAGTVKVTPFYSRTQAFNCDGTKFIVIGGSSRYYMFSAVDFSRIVCGKTNITPSGAVGSDSIFPQAGDDVSWHPTQAHLLRFIPSKTTTSGMGLRFYEYNVNTPTVAPVLMRTLEGRLSARSSSFGSATHLTTGGEGRPSDDGRYYCLAVRGGTPSSPTHLGYICYDYDNDTIVGHLATTAAVNSCAMSSLGNYCILSQVYSSGFATAAAGATSSPRGTRAYNRTFTTFNQLSDTSLHSDVCLDADGDEAYVSQAGPNFQQLEWGRMYYRKCSGGLPISLYQRNDAGSASQLHFCGTMVERPGWAIFSTYHDAAASETGWADYSIFAIKLENNPSSGNPLVPIRRIAHTRGGQSGGYNYQSHATASRDGLQILFGSGWRTSHPTGAFATVPETYLVGLPSTFYDDTVAGSGNEWGNNAVENGSFTTGMSPWTVPAGSWAFVSGGTTMQVTAPDSVLSQVCDLIPNQQYRITFDVFGYSATGSGIRAQFAGGTTVASAYQAGDGPKTVLVTTGSSSTSLQFRSSSDFAGSARINNVVAIPVL